jgi:hypothetical protein
MFDTLIYLGYFFLILNIIILLRYYSSHSRSLRIFTWYLIGILIIQITGFIFNRYSINNLFLSHFYFIFQFILLSLFYLSIVNIPTQRKIIKAGLSIGLFTLAAQYLSNSSIFWQFNLFEIFVTSFLVVIFSTFHLYNLLDGKKYLYYITLGVLIYLFSSTILFLAGNLVAKLSSSINTITWFLNALLYVVYQILVLVELKKIYLSKYS